MKLFIGSLPYNVTENELNEMFGRFGNVTKTKLVMDNFTGNPKDYGFVEMADRSEGQKAIEELNGKDYKYRKLICKEAEPLKTDK